VARDRSQSLLHQVKYSSIVLDALLLYLQHQVSIPSSSGQVFIPEVARKVGGGIVGSLNPFFIRSSIHPMPRDCRWNVAGLASQSLLHQVKYSSARAALGPHIVDVRLSQSLLHQVKYSSTSTTEQAQLTQLGSQSLLHQVKYSSFMLTLSFQPHRSIGSLNPFFIRSSIHPGCYRFEVCCDVAESQGLNPFFIRSSIHPYKNDNFGCRGKEEKVSIPSSSGQVFIRLRPWRLGRIARARCLNPFFIRSSIHPLHLTTPPCAHARSSLNPFFIRSSIHPVRAGPFCASKNAESQSLLHQVKYSSVCTRSESTRSGAMSLNPFFIRSSIHP